MALTWAQNISDGTKITLESIIEVRNNINIERVRRNLPAYNFVQPLTRGNKISVAVIQELKTSIIDIKSCTLTDALGEIFNELIDQYKSQLNTFNAESLWRWVFGPWEYADATPNGADNRFFQYAAEGLIIGWFYSYVVGGVAAQLSVQSLTIDGTYEGYNFMYQHITDAQGNLIGKNTNILYQVGPYVKTVDNRAEKYGGLYYYYYIRKGVYTNF